jgi:hypothetical protein
MCLMLSRRHKTHGYVTQADEVLAGGSMLQQSNIYRFAVALARKFAFSKPAYRLLRNGHRFVRYVASHLPPH